MSSCVYDYDKGRPTKPITNKPGASSADQAEPTTERTATQHSTLPKDLLQRIRAFKEILAEVDNVTLDEVIDDFKRDLHPEKEVAVWERIANIYQLFLLHNPTGDLAVKHDVFSVLLMTSLGLQDWSGIRYLDQDQIRQLVLNYRRLHLYWGP
jgi:hypothetical protein